MVQQNRGAEDFSKTSNASVHELAVESLVFPLKGATSRIESSQIPLIEERFAAAIGLVAKHLGALKNGVTLQILEAESSLNATLVIANRDAKLTDLFKGAPIGTLFRSNSIPSSMALYISPDSLNIVTLAHELSHLWVAQNYFDPPILVNEGVAEFVAHDGGLIQHRIEQLRQYGPISSEEFKDRTPLILRESESPRVYYASAWAVAYFLRHFEQIPLKRILSMNEFPSPEICWRVIDFSLQKGGSKP